MKKSEQTREAIVKSALSFFWDHPFRELTIAELMKRAGASRAAFYQYFHDLHELMAGLLEEIRTDILTEASSWFEGEGDPIENLKTSLTGLVKVCYERGPILRAISDAAVTDAHFEMLWARFLKNFDDAVAGNIEQQQAQGIISPFSAYPIAVALNRLDASILIEHFGKRPRRRRQEVLAALIRIWCSTLYGVSGEE